MDQEFWLSRGASDLHRPLWELNGWHSLDEQKKKKQKEKEKEKEEEKQAKTERERARGRDRGFACQTRRKMGPLGTVTPTEKENK